MCIHVCCSEPGPTRPRNRPHFLSDRAGSIFPVVRTPEMDGYCHSQSFRSQWDGRLPLTCDTSAEAKNNALLTQCVASSNPNDPGLFSYHSVTQPELPIKFVALHPSGVIKSKYKMGETRGIALGRQSRQSL